MSTVVERHIEATPGIRDGRPCIAGTRIAVSDLAIMHLKLGQSLEEIAGKYELSLAAVHAGMAYYYDHRAALDRAIAEDSDFVEAFAAGNVSPLQAKLRSLRNG
jgi:uncharacterized protein (DUF433 family)